MKALYRLLPAMLIALALDGLTKTWAERVLDLYQPWPALGQTFRLTLGYNTGVAFGLFANGGSWPLIVTGVIILGLAVWLTSTLRTGELPLWAYWPVGLLLGGALANFGDRLPDGRVTDFLDVGLGTSRWPTFNLPDTFIVSGMVILMLASFFEQRSSENER